jgi:hypothetical protein
LYGQYCFFENCAVYEIMWENVVQPDRQTDTDGSTIWRMHDLRVGELRQEYGHSKYVTLIA